jgi:methylated-DNA-[protein]-cysteine S-methyltransferase
MTTRFHVTDTPIGPLTLVADGPALVGIYFAEHRHQPDAVTFGPRDSTDPVLVDAAGQLDEYFAGQRSSFDLELSPRGDTFQTRVWGRLRDIPYGETTTYGTIAAELGNVGMARAVGAAVGRNPLSIVVPCHRVVGKNGSLTGFAGGLDRKAALLELEGAIPGGDRQLFAS